MIMIIVIAIVTVIRIRARKKKAGRITERNKRTRERTSDNVCHNE